jgi:hypothetical protein
MNIEFPKNVTHLENKTSKWVVRWKASDTEYFTKVAA